MSDCQTDNCWSIIGSASSHAALSALLATVAITSMVLLITLRRPGAPRALDAARAGAVMFFFATLLTAVLSSFQFGVIAGIERVAAERAAAAGVLTAALVGLAAVALFAALTWLLVLVETESSQLSRLGHVAIGVVAWIAVSHAGLTMLDFLDAFYAGNNYVYTAPTLTVIALGALAAILGFSASLHQWALDKFVSIRARFTRTSDDGREQRSTEGSSSGPVRSIDSVVHRKTSWAVMALVVLAFPQVLAFEWVVTSEPEMWASDDDDLFAFTMGWVYFALVFFAAVAVVLGSPSRHDWAKAREARQQQEREALHFGED